MLLFSVWCKYVHYKQLLPFEILYQTSDAVNLPVIDKLPGNLVLVHIKNGIKIQFVIAVCFLFSYHLTSAVLVADSNKEPLT